MSDIEVDRQKKENFRLEQALKAIRDYKTPPNSDLAIAFAVRQIAIEALS
jgi:hypothetical protein